MRVLIKINICILAFISTFVFADSLKIGVSTSHEPFAFFRKGKIVGFDIDVINRVCELQKYTCNIESQPWETLVSSLRFKKYDAIIGGITNEANQHGGVLLGYKYSSQKSVIVARMDSSFSSVCTKGCSEKVDLDNLSESSESIKILNEAFATAKFGVQSDTGTYTRLAECFPAATIERFIKWGDILLALKKGKINATVFKHAEAISFLKQDKNASEYIILPVTFSGSGFSSGSVFGFHGDTPSLKKKFNKGLMTLIESGEIDLLANKWFGSD